MGKKITNEDFIKVVYDLVQEEYSVLEEYKGTDVKILFKHNSCGNEYLVAPSKFKNNRRCPYCSRNKKKTHNEFLKEFYNKSNGDYELLSEYKTAKTKVKVKHNICGHVYEVRPDDFNRGRRCPECAKLKQGNKKKLHSVFERETKELGNNHYQVLTLYKSDNEYIMLKHLVCGHVYKVTPSAFLNGRRCPKCAKSLRKESQTRTHLEFEEIFNTLVDGEYSLLSKYSKSIDKIKIKHNICGNIYNVIANKFMQGSRCPKCICSKGEKLTQKYLNDNNIKNISQFKIPDCKNVRPLPFDFAIFDKDNNLKYLIEYQGIQHYEPRDFFGGEKSFKQTIINDKIKYNYCKSNNIPLIEIPYTVVDIRGFLDKKIKICQS